MFEIVKDLLTIVLMMTLTLDGEGKHPLHVAIQHEQECDIIYELFKACPEVRRVQDAATQLILFTLAGIGNWKKGSNKMSIIYHLLREDP